jgi:hypothetical protein
MSGQGGPPARRRRTWSTLRAGTAFTGIAYSSRASAADTGSRRCAACTTESLADDAQPAPIPGRALHRAPGQVSRGGTPLALGTLTGASTDGVRSPSAVLAARLSPAGLPAPHARPARPPWCGESDEVTRMPGFNGDAPFRQWTDNCLRRTSGHGGWHEPGRQLYETANCRFLARCRIGPSALSEIPPSRSSNW